MTVKPKILVVDDQMAVALMMVFLLTQAGCDVEMALNGAKALQLAQTEIFDLITLDIDMPGVNGFVLFQSLKQIPHLKDTPMIFVSGNSTIENQQRALDLGAADFIEKPFARRSRTISRSSLPSQKSITSLARAIRCSTWKLNGRPRRRHISSSSARCSSDMRMLYRRFFFATRKGCQSNEMNSLQKRVDNGRQRLNLNASLFPKRHRETSGRNGDSAARFYCEMNLANPAKRGRKREAHFQKDNL